MRWIIRRASGALEFIQALKRLAHRHTMRYVASATIEGAFYEPGSIIADATCIAYNLFPCVETHG